MNDIAERLEELRWKSDQVVTNHAGERVWLRQEPGHITDCCLASEPCPYHAKLTHQSAPKIQ